MSVDQFVFRYVGRKLVFKSMLDKPALVCLRPSRILPVTGIRDKELVENYLRSILAS